MKHDLKNHSTVHYQCLSLALAACLALPLPALAAAIALATAPLATTTTSTVKPNLMLMLDDSGSMDWDYMPDTAKNFSGKYGYNSNQCNGTFYNPAITYLPPVNSTGAPLNATPTSFTAAYKDGFVTGAGTVDLSTGFRGGSGSGASGISLTAGPAFYYTYSGNQTSTAQKEYFNTNSNFYKECNSAIGSTTVIDGAAVNTRFSKVRLAATPTTTITVLGSGGTGASITITNSGTRSNPAKVSNIKVTIGASTFEILKATTNTSRTASTLAGYIAAAINLCTTTAIGSCTANGYSATAASNVVTILGPTAAATATPVVTIQNGAVTTTAFPVASTTTVSSITVAGTPLLSGSASGDSTSLLASDIRSKINATGYSATVASNVVTITAPTSASTYTPVITVLSGSMTLATEAFPESTPAKLQNFANWYSYYSNRMLMMKTATGLAFNQVGDNYRVGFLSMNNNVSPGIVEAAAFDATQKSAWYTKLYAANPGGFTPLREALSKVGQYYAHKFGSITTYRATVTVGGSGSTVVEGITVNGVETMEDSTIASTITSTVAANISAQINAVQVTDYGASVSGNVITITGPATAAGNAPVVSNDGGGMTFSTTTFTGTTTTSQLNGVTPADPMQYSCQQNFTILSTDGYWNGATTYNLAGGTVDQQDGTAARPMNDGAHATTIWTNTYTRNDYSASRTEISGGTNCSTSSGKKRGISQPQICSCNVTVSGAACASACSSTSSDWSSNGSKVYLAGYTSDTATCATTVTLPNPDPSTRVLQSSVESTGTSGGTSNTLADVAMYYYQTDLRTAALGNCSGALSSSVCENNVFISDTDNNLQQHMTTFTLGLGARGRMVYSTSYLVDDSGDYAAVKLGSTASSSVCTWQTSGTSCNWPIPSSGAIENIDDLWHAAINGRGAYFSATDPTTLASGLSNALTSIKSKAGSAAAAATSTLNPVAGNNFAYVASYTTVTWKGNLEARGINTDSGAVSENASWCVENVPAETCATTPVAETSGDTTIYNCVTPNSTTCAGGTLVDTNCKVPVAVKCTGTMNAKVSDTSDTRTIVTANSTGTALINFDATYATANPTYFDAAHIATLSQWSLLTVAQKTAAAGANLINYLRGQYGYEVRIANDGPPDNKLFRYREAVLGDALESEPTYLSKPVFSYTYPGYSAYATAQAGRAGTIYIGTNDGMMHAFPADTGIERWAYVPSMVIPNMWKLADTNYATLHTNFVNGSQVTSDICTANCTDPATAVWKTILVGGLNAGGRGFYALDITNPVTPVLLWEFTTTAGIGKVTDDDLGYSFGHPIITRKADGTWVVLVTSGYDNGTISGNPLVNNSPAGDGKGYLYVLNASTGAIISKISTNVGSTTTPSGLSKVAAWNDEVGGNLAGYVYGGDLLGNLWRFNINSSVTAAIGTGEVMKFASLYSDAAGTSPQPITTTPVLGKIADKRVIFIGTGKYLETADLSTTQIQTQYAIKDDDATSTFVNPRNTLVQQTLTNNPDGTATRLVSSNAVDFYTGRGWYVNFPDSKERVNIEAKLVQGTLLVPTIVPENTACAPGGYGWFNYFSYATGGAVDTTGLASEKFDATIVGVNVIYVQGAPKVLIVTSADPTPKEPSRAPPFAGTPAGFTGKRVIWRELIP